MRRSVLFGTSIAILVLVAAPQLIQAQSVSCPALYRNLAFGAVGNDVQQLQIFLKAFGHFTYPEFSTRFGPATEAAVKSFQRAQGIVSSGSAATTGYGALGPATRAAIQRLCTNTASTVPVNTTYTSSNTAPALTVNLYKGITHPQVIILQQFLKQAGDFTYPELTTYFGAVTEAAVKKFQCRTMNICFGTADSTGYGVVGPATRRAIQNHQFATTNTGTPTTAQGSTNVYAQSVYAHTYAQSVYSNQNGNQQSTTYAQGTYTNTSGTQGTASTSGHTGNTYAQGTYTTAAGTASCTVSGTTYTHGQSASFYTASSVFSQTNPQKCPAAVTRMCSNGVMSGSASAIHRTCEDYTKFQKLLHGDLFVETIKGTGYTTAYFSSSPCTTYRINWGDGLSTIKNATKGPTACSQSEVTTYQEAHTYAVSGDLTVEISRVESDYANHWYVPKKTVAINASVLASGATGCTVTVGSDGSRKETGCSVAVDKISSDVYSCTKPALSSTQQSLVTAFDQHVGNFGDGYSLQNNRSGALANTVPEYLNGLLDAYVGTKNDKYLHRFIQHADRVLGHRDDKAGYKDYAGRSAATWSSNQFDNQYVSYLYEDGSLIAPMAQFAAIVKNASCLQSVQDASGRTFNSVADIYAQAAGETVSFHLKDWHTATAYGNSVGYYTAPTDIAAGHLSPGRVLPVNYQSAMGSALAYLYKATGDSSYLSYARLLAYFVLTEMADAGLNADGGYKWKYNSQMLYAPGAGWTDQAWVEDISHASITVQFMRAMYESSAGVFNSTDMARMAKTYSATLYNNGSPNHNLDGTGGAGGSKAYQYAFAAALLSPYESGLWGKAYYVAINVLHTDVVGNLQSASSFTGIARLIRYAQ